MHQGANLLIGQRTIVGKFTNMWVRMPRRHALSADNFSNHQTETTHHVVVGHRPRANAAFAVTAHTVVIEHGGDRVGVGNCFVLGAASELWKIHRAV